jgi:hypothetical protein
VENFYVKFYVSMCLCGKMIFIPALHLFYLILIIKKTSSFFDEV